MKLSKKQLSLEDGITKEWVITNGIGGFASQSVLGINTRKYHGLLIAPLMPPARRYVILSKIDESIEINEKEEILLLTQKKEMNQYWSWTASRPFFDGAVPAEEDTNTPDDGDKDIELAKHVIEVEDPEFDDTEYDMTQV